MVRHMKNNVSKVLIGIALMFTAGAAYSEPVEHTFSTTGPIFIDPLLTGLTSVSGSFTYENAAAPFGTTGDESRQPESTIYRGLSNLSGAAEVSSDPNGKLFYDTVGSVIVGDDRRLGTDTTWDIFELDWDSAEAPQTLSGFSLDGMPLVNVVFFWIEGRDGIVDFLEDQSLPSVLPPTISGRLSLDFDGADGLLRAVFYVTVVPVKTANSDIFFSGPIVNVNIDTGGIYSGVLPGDNFFGAINRLTSDGFISDGTTSTPFSFGEYPDNGVEVSNDLVLDAEFAALLTALGGPRFFEEGDIVDQIKIQSDSVPLGGLLFVGLVYVLDHLAFDDESRNNYPPDPNDIRIQFFYVDEEGVDEEGGVGPNIFSAHGIFAVEDIDDVCPNTIIPEFVPNRSLGVNRFALTDNSDYVFDTTSPKGEGPRRSYNTVDTAGCSCTQIIDALGLGKGHTEFGCSISTMDEWVALPNP